MRFLIPIVVIMVTSFFVPRGAEEGKAAIDTAPFGYVEKGTEAVGAANSEQDDSYDVIIESSGMLNRLELLNF